MDKEDIELINSLVKTLVLPKVTKVIEKGLSKINQKGKLAIHDHFKNNFQEYLNRRYKKFSILDTLVFPNKQTKLDNLYLPLNLVSDSENYVKEIDDYPDELFKKYKNILVIDTAGMGKSTLSKRIFQSAIREQACIPVLIELSKINSEKSLTSEIFTQLAPLDQEVDSGLVYELIKRGDFLFIFDGFDEVSETSKSDVIRQIKEFTEKAGENNFMITSRPEESLTSFGAFQAFNIEPLLLEQARDLIKKYDQYNYRAISDSLIESLTKIENKGVEEFLENPLLASLLYKAFDYKKQIPLKKTQFYRQVFDAFFEAHDLSKEGYLKREKFCKLHIDDFDMVMRYVGYYSAKVGKVEYDKNTLISIIEKAKSYYKGLEFKPSDLLKDLLNTVPLFKREGNAFKWSHKSLQDYFAAKFIWLDSDELQEGILRKVYEDRKNSRFENILDIFYDLSRKKFHETITFWLLEDYVKYYESLKYNDSKFKDEISGFSFLDDHLILIRESKKKTPLSIDNDAFKQLSDYTKDKYNQEVTFFYVQDFEETLYGYHTTIQKNQNLTTIVNLLQKKKLPFVTLYEYKKIRKREIKRYELDKVFLLTDEKSDFVRENIKTLKKYFIPNSFILHEEAVKYYETVAESNFENKSDNELLDW